MKILVVYATYSSSTAAASGVVEDVLKSQGHEVTRQTAFATKPDDLTAYDYILLGSPSWEVEKKDGQPHIHFCELIKKLEGKKLEGKKFAIFGLGDNHYARFCGAVDHLEELVKRLGGQLIAGSLRINKYYFDEENNAKILTSWSEKIVKTA